MSTENKNTDLNDGNVEKIIIDTFKGVLEMPSADDDKAGSCEEGPVLMYPEYRDKETVETPVTRISEQELKQKFIACLGDSKIKCFYSVETPSKNTYNFKGEIPKRDDSGGKSALFDLSLYDKSKEIFSHLEFKCGNVKCLCITKDLLKLSEEPGKGKNYFIHIVDGFNDSTMKSLTKKYVGEPPDKNKDVQDLYETIKKGLNEKIIIYLLVVRNQIKEYEGSQKEPVRGYFKLVYNNGLNWNNSWYRYDENNNEFEPRIPQG